MKVHPTTVFYLSCIVLAIALCYIIGRIDYNAFIVVQSPSSTITWKDNFLLEMFKWFSSSQAIILLQVAIIIIVARLTGMLFKRIGQPVVMGEIVAGIVLGPSMLGLFAPQISEVIFPKSSLSNLQVLSNLGLLIFMFIVGIEFKLNVIKEEARTVFSISYASILLPFLMGFVLAMTVLRTYAPANIPLLIYYLYMGVAICITSFTVLARILRDRNLTNTRLGSLVISCTAINDIVAWCILAFVIAAVKAGTGSFAVYTLLMVAAYIALMILVVKPVVRNLFKKSKTSSSAFFIVFSTLLLSSYLSEMIGVHMLFGAFLAGAVMPEGVDFRKHVVDKLESFSFVLLLPLYFAFTGLRTQIGLLNDPNVWTDCILIILVASLSKFVGCMVAAKTMGETTQSSVSIGVLMNTRGLTELVVLNIGYELGILSPQLFTCMVLMALVTTFITSPVMNLIDRPKYKVPATAIKAEAFLHEVSV